MLLQVPLVQVSMCTLGNGRYCVGNHCYGIGSIHLHSAVTGTTGSGGNGSVDRGSNDYRYHWYMW